MLRTFYSMKSERIVKMPGGLASRIEEKGYSPREWLFQAIDLGLKIEKRQILETRGKRRFIAKITATPPYVGGGRSNVDLSKVVLSPEIVEEIKENTDLKLDQWLFRAIRARIDADRGAYMDRNTREIISFD